jgi:hypothetical protein
MNTENAKSNRGAVLLGELKALVDSFPEDQRKTVIKIIGTVVTKLSAGCETRHSANPWPERESRTLTTSPQAARTDDLNE